MKFIAFFLLVASLQVSAHGYGQQVNLSFKDAPLEKVFSEIKKQTGYNFVYGNDVLKNAKKVTIDLKGVTIEQALETIFQDQQLTYAMVEKVVVVKLKPQSPNVESHTEKKPPVDIKGRITNELGEPVAGASVTVKRTNQGTNTDNNGVFELNNLDEDDVLLISAANIEPRQFKVSAVVDLMVNSSAGIAAISAKIKIAVQEEVIVNAGYYDVKKREATGSISRVDAKVIEKQPVTNPLAALHGRMPGVQIQQTNGVPGTAFKIEIRGRNSLRGNNNVSNGNDPLYVIDGVPFSSQSLSNSERKPNRTYAGSVIYGGVSPLTSINPADIESIEVLKDADATAIYGSRGANGVVLITTKKGKAGKTKFDVNYYSGFSRVNLVKQLNTQQYLAVRREAFALEGLTPTANPNDNGTVNSNYRAYALDLMVWDTTRYTDWQKYFIGGTAHTTSLQSSLSWGNESTQFLGGVGYYKETTVFAGDFNFRKLSSHLNVNHKSVNKKFSFNASVSGGWDMHDQPQFDFSLYARKIAPNAPKLFDENGNLNWENSTWENPLALLERVYDASINNIISSSIAGYQVVPGLNLQVKSGITRTESNEKNIFPSTAYDPALGIGSEASVVNTSAGRRHSWIIEPQLNWEKEISKGLLTILTGGSYQKEQYQFTALGYQNFPSNTLLHDISTAAIRTVNDYDKSIYKYAAAFGRINYNWEKKYIINLTGRRDGSSRFGPGKQYANFYATGLAWVFSKEAWLEKNISWLSFGKLRASYGITGSDQIGNYRYLDTYAATQNASNTYNGVTTLDPTRLFNSAYGWETNKKLEAAVDLGFLQDRVNFSAAWYRNRSSNQLINYTLPAITGFNGILANFPATVQNTGIEIEFASDNIQTKKFSWSTSLNLSFPRNKLISFPNIDSSTYANQYIVGEPIYIRKFYQYTGIDPQTGLYTVKDVDGDGKISFPNDEASTMFIGQDFFGGINNSFAYKALTLDIFLQVVRQTGIYTSFAPGWQGHNVPAYILELKRWQKPGDNAEIQRFQTEYSRGLGIAAIANSSTELFLNSDAAVTDASFIRLKTISLQYQVPPSKLKGINCRAYLRGQNLFVLTKYKGSDPETQNGWMLPPLKTISIGISVTL